MDVLQRFPPYYFFWPLEIVRGLPQEFNRVLLQRANEKMVRVGHYTSLMVFAFGDRCLNCHFGFDVFDNALALDYITVRIQIYTGWGPASQLLVEFCIGKSSSLNKSSYDTTIHLIIETNTISKSRHAQIHDKTRQTTNDCPPTLICWTNVSCEHGQPPPKPGQPLASPMYFGWRVATADKVLLLRNIPF